MVTLAFSNYFSGERKGDLSIDLFSVEEIKDRYKQEDNRYFSHKEASRKCKEFIERLQKYIPNIKFTYHRDEVNNRLQELHKGIRFRISIPEEFAKQLYEAIEIESKPLLRS